MTKDNPYTILVDIFQDQTVHAYIYPTRTELQEIIHRKDPLTSYEVNGGGFTLSKKPDGSSFSRSNKPNGELIEILEWLGYEVMMLLPSEYGYLWYWKKVKET